MSWDLCAPPPVVHFAAGPDLLNAWPSSSPDGDRNGVAVARVDPGWSGAGWDQQAIFGVRRGWDCARLGVREQVVWHNVSEQTLWDVGRYSGSELHFVTSPMVGGELHLPAWFAAGAYALPGLRTVYTHQRATVPERGLERTETHLSFVPTLSAYAVLRWVPARSPVGLHADVELPVVNTFRELGWYPHRILGVGLDLRLERAR